MRYLLTFVVVILLSLSVLAGEIHQAAIEGNLDLVKKLFDENPELLTTLDNTGKSPLHQAAYNGQIEVARYLIDKGADLNILTTSGSAPLHGAAFYGYPEAVKLLIEKGADINLANNYGFTPLLSGSAGGQLEPVKILLDAGADINVVVDHGRANALLLAASSGNYELVEYLIDHGFSIGFVDGDNAGVMQYASYGGNIDLIKKLVSLGADINEKSNDGMTPLLNAAQGHKFETVKYFVEKGADVNASDNDNQTAIHKVVNAVYPEDTTGTPIEMVKYLVNKGADINARTAGQYTPLHLSIYRNNLDLMEQLIKLGAYLDAQTESGLTPLHEAIRRSKLEMAQKLIEHGAKTDVKENKLGLTQLHDTAIKGNLEMMQTVLGKSNDINIKNNDGHTPIYYATKYGHKQIADLLKKKGAKESNLIENYSSAKALNKKLNDNEVEMWYLGHVGWAIKTKNHFLIFDYWTRNNEPTDPCLANGYLMPEEIKDQNVELFVSHDHQDHYDGKIFELKQAIPEISFIFGFHPEDLGPEDARGYAGQPYEYIDFHQTKTIDGMTITPIQANDAGQGFLVEVDGLTIYHAGDHAGWREGQREGFTREIDFLADKVENLDFAFVNVTGCHVQDTVALAEATFYTIDKLNPKILIPTHGIDREYVYKEYADKIHAQGYNLDVLCAEFRGDMFVYKNDQIM